mmetsp:Transcript_28812/g.67192  ORF Transcript_28812/g.67192 Transcript_28812/m.67192 type:complete len:111 (-) Transcript_28812:188-520(-)
MMPGKFTPETLPRPDSRAVSFRTVPAGEYAVVTFSGAPPNEEVVEERAEQVRQALRDAGLEPIGLPRLDQYHPPFALSCQRRNEVLMRYRGKPPSPPRRMFPRMFWENSV